MKIEVHLQGGLRKIIDITPGATVGATIGRNVFNADGTLYVPPSSGGASQLSITSWELILNIPPNVTALANTATTGLYVVTGSGTSATRSIEGPASVVVSDGNGVAGNPSIELDGDDLAPGGLYSYATDQSGAKGWHRPALFESTGLLAWEAPYLSVNGSDPTKFDVGAAVVGYTDYDTNPVAPGRAYAVYGPTTANSVPSLADIATWVGIDTPGLTLVMQNTAFTPTQRRHIVQLGAVISNGAQLIAVNTLPMVMRSGINQISDFMLAVGPINSGNLIGPNGANLQINKGAGVVFKEGANFANNPDDPHNLPLPALTAANFNYRTSTGVQATTTNSINVTQYESPLGTLATVSNNRFTVQRIYVFTSNLIRIQYGQTEYQTMAEAEAAIATQPFATEANIAENGVLLAFLIVEKNATDLSNTAQAKFIPADKFGGVVGSGGTSITNTDSLPEGVVNLYYTDARSRAAVIASTIVNGDTTHSPSGDAVFDALATKEPAIASGLASQVWRGDKTWGDTVPGNFGASPPGAWSGPAFLFDGSAGGGFFVQNNSQGRVAVRTAGSQSQFIGMTHGGTIASPSATGNGVPLFELYGSGFGGITYGFNGLFSFVTTQSHTESARGTEGRIATTANGSASVTNRWRWGNDGHYTPFADNTYDVGSGSFRCRTIYAGTGAINTSDEREKTIRGPLNIHELAAAEELASACVIYQWNEAIDRKGSDARLHFGPTVQSVMSIMQKHGLDPFRYGFVCYDRWDESPEVWNEWPAKDEVIDDAGNLVSPATPAGRELTSEYIPAGDRYSLRPSELQFFIARGQEERIRRLEALLNP